MVKQSRELIAKTKKKSDLKKIDLFDIAHKRLQSTIELKDSLDEFGSKRNDLKTSFKNLLEKVKVTNSKLSQNHDDLSLLVEVPYSHQETETEVE